MIVKKCVVCEKEFKARSVTHKTCSKFCRGLYCLKQPVCLFNQIKLEQILKQDKTCPGCGHKFDTDDEYALLMIFHSCHIHSHACELYDKYERKQIFYACSFCNYRQTKFCGYWIEPNRLQTTCLENNVIKTIPSVDVGLEVINSLKIGRK